MAEPGEQNGKTMSPKRRMSLADGVMLALMFVLPILVAIAGALVGIQMHGAFPVWLAAVIGFIVAFVLVFSGGADQMDVIVRSAILLILVGILFPIFSNAREKARQKERARFQQQRQLPIQTHP